MNIQDELLYIDKVIRKLSSRDKLMAIEPDIGHVLMWEELYTKSHYKTLSSLGSLFANEYYRMMLEGKI